MSLKKYMVSMTASERENFAKRCDTSTAHLRNVAYGYKTCGVDLAMAIDQESGGEIKVETLRPDLEKRWSHLRNSVKAA